MRTLILALAICAPLSSAGASFVSGNLLFLNCGKSASAAEQAFCQGYFSAIADAMKSGDSVDRFRACIPSAANAGHLQDQLFRHLDTNRLYRHYNASTIVARFLAETFPCT